MRFLLRRLLRLCHWLYSYHSMVIFVKRQDTNGMLDPSRDPQFSWQTWDCACGRRERWAVYNHPTIGFLLVGVKVVA